MKACFSLIAILMIMTEWNIVDSRYVPMASRSGQWHTSRNIGRLRSRVSWQQGQPKSRGGVWPQRIFRGTGQRLDSTRPNTAPRISPSYHRLSDVRNIASILERRPYLQSRNKLIPKQSANRIDSFNTKHEISVSSDDGDHSSITFTNKNIQPRAANQNVRHSIGRMERNGFKSMDTGNKHNSGLHLRMNFRSHRLGRRPLHDIFIRTKTGRRINISHSMGKTNIILNGMSNTMNHLTKSRPVEAVPTPIAKTELTDTTSNNQLQIPPVPASNTKIETQTVLQETKQLADEKTVTSNSISFAVTSTPRVDQAVAPTTSLLIDSGIRTEENVTPNPKTVTLLDELGINNATQTPTDAAVTIKVTHTTHNKTLHGHGIANNAERGTNISTSTKVEPTIAITSAALQKSSKTSNAHKHSQTKSTNSPSGEPSQRPNSSESISIPGTSEATLDDQSEAGKADGDMTRDQNHPEAAAKGIDGVNMEDMPDGSDWSDK